MNQVMSYAAPGANRPLEPTPINRRKVGEHDVLIAISYAGICHSDIHTVRGEWGERTYPLAPGHEIVGRVTAVGTGVTKHALGDLVGVGCMVNSCQNCANCERGLEQFCAGGMVGTYGSVDRDGTITQGGYSTHIVVNENFVLRAPESLDERAIAPLLCCGITLFSPLRHWKVGPGTKVAVLGLGGLGHIGVKLAAAMGAHVTVLSHSPSKKSDAIELGAHDFVDTSAPGALDNLRNTFDLILNTVSVPIDVNQYLGLLRTNGTMVVLGLPDKPLEVNAFSLLGQRRSLAGSLIGGIPETQEMLDFCAAKGIVPEVELIAAQDINVAYDRVVASDVRYRFVIDMSTMPPVHESQ